MRKSTLFISSVLITFALVILYGVISSYQNARSTAADVVAVSSTATLEPEPTDIPAQPTRSFITPEQAAQLAAQVVGHSDLLSAESSSLNGVDAYLITFTNKDVVYVGLDGQILSVQIAPVVVNIAPVVKQNNKNNNSSQSNSNHSESEHEEHEDDGD